MPPPKIHITVCRPAYAPDSTNIIVGTSAPAAIPPHPTFSLDHAEVDRIASAPAAPAPRPLRAFPLYHRDDVGGHWEVNPSMVGSSSIPVKALEALGLSPTDIERCTKPNTCFRLIFSPNGTARLAGADFAGYTLCFDTTKEPR